MTALKLWAFIYKSPGSDPQAHHAEFLSQKHRTLIFGVDNLDEACQLARRLVGEGCIFLELCGGFGEEGARRVIEAIDCDVPVGYVGHSPQEAEKLKRQLEKFAP